MSTKHWLTITISLLLFVFLFIVISLTQSVAAQNSTSTPLFETVVALTVEAQINQLTTTPSTATPYSSDSVATAVAATMAALTPSPAPSPSPTPFRSTVEVPGNAGDGVTFSCEIGGIYTVLYTDGAYSPWESGSGGQWRTMLYIYRNRTPEWEVNQYGFTEPSGSDGSVGRMELNGARDTQTEAENNALGDSFRIDCESGEYLRFVPVDEQDAYEGNSGSVFVTVQLDTIITEVTAQCNDTGSVPPIPEAPPNGCVLIVEWLAASGDNPQDCGILLTRDEPLLEEGTTGTWKYEYAENVGGYLENFLGEHPSCRIEDVR